MELSRKALKCIIAVISVSLLTELLRMIFPFAPLFTLAGMIQKEAGSIGIIGSADGPTAIFTTTKLLPPLGLFFSLCSLAETILLVFLLIKAVKALRK